MLLDDDVEIQPRKQSGGPCARERGIKAAAARAAERERLCMLSKSWICTSEHYVQKERI